MWSDEPNYGEEQKVNLKLAYRALKEHDKEQLESLEFELV